MRISLQPLFAFLGLATMGFPSFFSPHPKTTPAGLSPGEQYRLVFVTSDTTTATSTNIADYNAFVTTEANADPQLAALNVAWAALASTSSVDAYENIGGAFTTPIYNLDGQLVADGSSGLWGGNNLADPIDVDQYGDLLQANVWGGTTAAGTAETE